MDQTTQQNAALVEEGAAAAESLEEQARALADAVRMFKLAGAAKPRMLQGLHAPADESAIDAPDPWERLQ